MRQADPGIFLLYVVIFCIATMTLISSQHWVYATLTLIMAVGAGGELAIENVKWRLQRKGKI